MDIPQNDLEALRKILADLTARVYRIEHKLGIDAESGEQPRAAVAVQPAPVRSSATISRGPAPPPPPPRVPTHVKPTFPADSGIDLESRIGSHWLNRIGIAALLIGVSYFLKFAFDNNWIGPAGRVSIGILAGIAVVVWSERSRAKGYKAFSCSLKAVGIGTLYLSLWAAFQLYALLPSGVAFLAMVIVTSATVVMAWTQDAEILAAFALAGGFSTPLLLSTGQNHE